MNKIGAELGRLGFAHRAARANRIKGLEARELLRRGAPHGRLEQVVRREADVLYRVKPLRQHLLEQHHVVYTVHCTVQSE